MDLSALGALQGATPGATGPATPVVPQHVADLRPSADAAALGRNPRPAAATAAVLPAGAMPVATLPAPTSQAGAISRCLIGATPVEVPGRAVTQAERVLKPWGVPMLPAGQAETAGPARQAGADGATRTGRAAADPPAKESPATAAVSGDNRRSPGGQCA